MTDKNAKNENSKIRIMTFFPPFIILVAFLVLSLVDQETFLGVINNINNWIIKNLGWAASILALAIVIVAVVAMFSKFGDVRIGGEDAKPELSNFFLVYYRPHNNHGSRCPLLGTGGADRALRVPAD